MLRHALKILEIHGTEINDGLESYNVRRMNSFGEREMLVLAYSRMRVEFVT